MPEVASVSKIKVSKVCPICDQTYPIEFNVCPRDAVRLEDIESEDADPLIGAVLGGAFRVIKPVGEGATAKVYEARHVRLGKKRFAVKVLHSFYATNPTAVARFQREAEAAAGIGHPGIVDVYDVNRTEDGRFYLATEFLDGTDLSSLLKERAPLEIPFAVRVARGVCRALGAAHAAGVIHRDIKPANVFLMGDRERPTIKVLDFGISKIDDNASLTRTGMIVGTPAYMSPEQAAGRSVDARTDVYAVGALLYHAVTGRLPFEGGEGAEVLSSILSEEPPRPRSLRADIPEALELVIERAMSKDLKQRPATITELDRLLAPFDTEARPSVMMAPRPVDPELANEAREAGSARMSLIVLTVILALWTVGILDAAVLAVLGASDKAPAPEPHTGRLIGVTIGMLLVIAGPLVIWIRRLSHVWKTTVRAVEHARLLRRMLVGALGGYAVGSVGIRLLSYATLPGGGGFGPLGEFAIAFTSILGAAAMAFSARRKRQA